MTETSRRRIEAAREAKKIVEGWPASKFAGLGRKVMIDIRTDRGTTERPGGKSFHWVEARDVETGDVITGEYYFEDVYSGENERVQIYFCVDGEIYAPCFDEGRNFSTRRVKLFRAFFDEFSPFLSSYGAESMED